VPLSGRAGAWLGPAPRRRPGRAAGIAQTGAATELGRRRCGTYAYVTPLFGEPLWAGAFVGAALVFGAVALELRGR
jgi:hypothetical protein